MKVTVDQLRALVRQQIQEYGDHETQAAGGMVSSSHSSDPEFDQVQDIALTVVEQGGQLMQIANALKDEAFDARVLSGVLVVGDKYFIGKPSKFDIDPAEDFREIGPYVLGHQHTQNPMQEDSGDSMIAKATAIFPEAEVYEDDMGGFEIVLSPESIARLESDPQLQGQLSDAFGDTWEMTEDGIAVGAEFMQEKLSPEDKKFHQSVMDKGKVPNLKGDMGPIPGMEGPFQFKSGAVLYYDPKEGAYYDRGKDMYIDREEAAALTMEALSGLAVADSTPVPTGKTIKISLNTIRDMVRSHMQEGAASMFEKGDQVNDIRNDKAYKVTEVRADGAVMVVDENGDPAIIKADHLKKVEGTPKIDEEVSPEQQEANEKAYSRCFEMGRKGVDVKTALRGGPVADFAACRAGHKDGANEFMQRLAESRTKKVLAEVKRILSEK